MYNPYGGYPNQQPTPYQGAQNMYASSFPQQQQQGMPQQFCGVNDVYAQQQQQIAPSSNFYQNSANPQYQAPQQFPQQQGYNNPYTQQQNYGYSNYSQPNQQQGYPPQQYPMNNNNMMNPQPIAAPNQFNNNFSNDAMPNWMNSGMPQQGYQQQGYPPQQQFNPYASIAPQQQQGYPPFSNNNINSQPQQQQQQQQFYQQNMNPYSNIPQQQQHSQMQPSVPNQQLPSNNAPPFAQTPQQQVPIPNPSVPQHVQPPPPNPQLNIPMQVPPAQQQQIQQPQYPPMQHPAFQQQIPPQQQPNPLPHQQQIQQTPLITANNQQLQQPAVQPNLFNMQTQIDYSTQKFVDHSFPATSASLYNDQSKKLPNGAKKVTKWLRPHEFTKNPQLFVEGSSSGDCIQGQIGDCWFLGALSVIACRSDLINRCIVSKPANAGANGSGRYVFRFFKEGEWKQVEIDDLLPCDEHGHLVFARCSDSNEIWVPLFEKAYAKLYGSYQSLELGVTSNALVDLTGGVDIGGIEVTPTMSNSSDLWNKLLKFTNQKCYFMACSAKGGLEEGIEDTGLLSGHAYALLDCIEVFGNKLLKLRNPWGNCEWKLRFSDNSKEMTPELKQALQFTSANDGLFVMEYSDFCKYWKSIDIVRVFNDPMEVLAPQQANVVSPWTLTIQKSNWKGITAGGTLNNEDDAKHNPQFEFSINVKTEVWIALMQKDYRYQGDDKEKHFAIGFYVMKQNQDHVGHRISARFAEALIGKTEFWEASREVAVKLELEAGSYVVMPTAFKKGDEGEFTLRCYAFQAPVALKPLL